MKSERGSVVLHSRWVRFLGALSVCAGVAQSGAVTIYDEGSDGDFSDSGAAPTQLVVSAGINEIYGTTGKASSTAPVDRDYFTFAVPSGYELVAIQVLPGTQPIGNLSFFAVEAGTQVTVDPASFSAAGLLGYVHYNAANGNIINDLAIPASPNPPAAGSSGFTPPLGAGDYAFWVQETSVGESPYGFAFQIQAAVPEGGPGLFGAIGAIGALMGFARRRGRQIS